MTTEIMDSKITPAELPKRPSLSQILDRALMIFILTFGIGLASAMVIDTMIQSFEVGAFATDRFEVSCWVFGMALAGFSFYALLDPNHRSS